MMTQIEMQCMNSIVALSQHLRKPRGHFYKMKDGNVVNLDEILYIKGNLIYLKWDMFVDAEDDELKEIVKHLNIVNQ